MSNSVSLSELFRVFGRIGVTSFGGPAAQIALMHKELVDDRPWLSEKQFLSALSFCMLLPGPEAMQLATYSGWKLRGTLGGLIAGLLFVLPGALVIMALALGYAYWGDVPAVQSVFLGIKATVIVIVLQALAKVAGKALKGTDAYVIAALSFLAIFMFDLPFPLIILIAALWGFRRADTTAREGIAKPNGVGTLSVALVWLAVWALPFPILWLTNADLLLQLAEFFSVLAVVTFGGAYAVLAYMTQAVAGDFGWLTTAEMIDALGLAETTPGPLILVTEFVGILTGFKAGGPWLAIAAGVVTLWVTFAPCFLWIFVGAPYLTWLSDHPRISAALSSISAAVVGVILNLSVWFSLNVFFQVVSDRNFGPFALPIPEVTSLNLTALLLCLVSAALLIGLKRSMLQTLFAMGTLGYLISLIG